MSEANAPINGVDLRIGNARVSLSALFCKLMELNQVLITILPIKYQKQNKLNCAILYSYVVAISVCCGCWAASNLIEALSFRPILRNTSLLLGALATDLLLMILVPVVGWPILLIWLIVVVIVVRGMVVQLLRQIYQAILAAIDELGNSVLVRLIN